MRLFEIEKTIITPEDEKYYKQLAKTYLLPWSNATVANFEFVKKVKQDCQPYLQEAGSSVFSGNGIWRGINESDPRLRKTARLENREPAGTPLIVHKYVNEYLNKKFGHPFRNGVFVTGERGQYGTYGVPYQIFPIGKFEYLWSDKVKDLLFTLRDFERDNDFDSPENYSYEKELKPKLVKFTRKLRGYKKTDLPAAAFSGNEIMIWCKQYYALHRSIARNEKFADAAANIIR